MALETAAVVEQADSVQEPRFLYLAELLTQLRLEPVALLVAERGPTETIPFSALSLPLVVAVAVVVTVRTEVPAVAAVMVHQ